MKVIGILIVVLAVILGVLGVGYIGIYWGMYLPFMTISEAMNQGTMTFSIFAWEAFQFVIKEFLCSLWLALCIGLGVFGISITR